MSKGHNLFGSYFQNEKLKWQSEFLSSLIEILNNKNSLVIAFNERESIDAENSGVRLKFKTPEELSTALESIDQGKPDYCIHDPVRFGTILKVCGFTEDEISAMPKSEVLIYEAAIFSAMTKVQYNQVNHTGINDMYQPILNELVDDEKKLNEMRKDRDNFQNSLYQQAKLFISNFKSAALDRTSTSINYEKYSHSKKTRLATNTRPGKSTLQNNSRTSQYDLMPPLPSAKSNDEAKLKALGHELNNLINQVNTHSPELQTIAMYAEIISRDDLISFVHKDKQFPNKIKNAMAALSNMDVPDREVIIINKIHKALLEIRETYTALNTHTNDNKEEHTHPRPGGGR